MRVAYLSRVACACGVKEKINVLGVVKYFTPVCQLLMHFLLALERFFDYAAINIIPDYPPHGVYRGQHRGFSNISLQILPQERGISSFSGTGRLKKHTNTLIIATQMCPSAGALARMNC